MGPKDNMSGNTMKLFIEEDIDIDGVKANQ